VFFIIFNCFQLISSPCFQLTIASKADTIPKEDAAIVLGCSSMDTMIWHQPKPSQQRQCGKWGKKGDTILNSFMVKYELNTNLALSRAITPVISATFSHRDHLPLFSCSFSFTAI
jgi:hypothetical protein